MKALDFEHEAGFSGGNLIREKYLHYPGIYYRLEDYYNLEEISRFNPIFPAD
jgi:hypothetical protein